MTKATDAQIKDTRKALASGGTLPKGVRINFGDSEPIQKADGDSEPNDTGDKAGKK